MNRDRHIALTVNDWPAFGRSMTLCLDRSLYPTAEDLAGWARRRFGPGELSRTGAIGRDEQWEYRREIGRGRGLLKLLTLLLNRSYG